MLARLYVKSAEIEASGKTYLRSAWRDKGCEDRRVWRLEFEYHKDKLDEIMGGRKLASYDEDSVRTLHSYGVHSLEYCAEAAPHRNLSQGSLHPLW